MASGALDVGDDPVSGSTDRLVGGVGRLMAATGGDEVNGRAVTRVRRTALGRGGALVAVAVVALAGCSTGPGEAEVAAQSDRVRGRVLELAGDAVAQVEREYGDQGVAVVHFPESEDGWQQCADFPVGADEIPESIQWSSNWTVTFDPKRETQSLLAGLIAPYLADGWKEAHELQMDGGRLVTIVKDGYTMQWGGDAIVDAHYVASIGVKVFSPCVPAPEDIWEWRPQASPSPTASS